jgi:hypothetical protein
MRSEQGAATLCAQCLQMGMRFLAIDEAQLQDVGSRPADEFPGLGETVWTIDFSGWPVFCLAIASEAKLYDFCAALKPQFLVRSGSLWLWASRCTDRVRAKLRRGGIDPMRVADRVPRKFVGVSGE